MMMTRKKGILLAALSALTLICALPLTAQDLFFSGDIKTSQGAAAPWTDKDSTAGRYMLGNTSFTGTIDAWYDKSSAYAEGTVNYDATQTANGSNISDALSFSLGELWLDYTDSSWGLRIGRQIEAWGAADGVDITNVLCPSDMSSFAAMTGDNSKLPVDGIRLSFSGDTFTADAWWIPIFTPAALPLKEGNSLRKFIVPASVAFPVQGTNTVLTLPVKIASVNNPEKAIWNGEYAVNASGYFSSFDASFYAFYGWDDTPFMDYTLEMSQANPALPTGITVSGSYQRMAMIGADSSIPLGETVLRLETAFFPQRHFQKSAESIIQEKMTAAAVAAASGSSPAGVETSEKRNQLSALAGIDWMPSGWTLTAQYYCDIVFGELDKLDRKDAYSHGATVSVSKTFLDETLEASFSGLIGFNDFDSMISPSVKYSLSDQISLGAGAYIFIPGPDRKGKYGAYKDLSTIYINAKYSF